MRSFLMAALAVSAVGCGVSEVQVDETAGVDATAEETGELSTRSASYVVFRPDLLRKCPAPRCGGKFIQDVNRKTVREEYVSGFDFSLSGLTEEAQAKVLEGAPGEVVLKGKLGPTEPVYNTRTFLVMEAFRGMPGVVAVPGESYFRVERADNIRCIAAPCPSLRAIKLHTTQETLFHEVSVARASKTNVDARWMTSRITDKGALVTAAFVTANRSTTLDASQVFMRLPEPSQSCPRVAIHQCAAGYTLSWARNENRCLIPTGCVRTVTCPQIRPYCDADYSAMTWNGGTNACPRAICDPTWVTQ
ncbi:MAG: hypothetical protein JNM69_11025 [Archangium sp.]|nr:hypothetical protein [Archangium sp.]